MLPTISKKTQKKLEWLDGNYSTFRYKCELIKEFSKKFNICEKHALRIIKIYLGERDNTSGFVSRRRNPLAQISDDCYFCKSKEELFNHHINYYPEVMINLCKSCHSKIHRVMESHHEIEIKRTKMIQQIKKYIKMCD